MKIPCPCIVDGVLCGELIDSEDAKWLDWTPKGPDPLQAARTRMNAKWYFSRDTQTVGAQKHGWKPHKI